MCIRGNDGVPKYIDILSPRNAEEIYNAELVRPSEIIKDILPPGAAILAGQPKSGKSIFAIQLALAVANGMPFLGNETSKCRVLYFDLESTDWLCQSRIELYCRSEMELTNLDVITQSDVARVGKLGEGLEEQIEEYVRRHQDCKLIIVDTLGQVLSSVSIGDSGSGGQYVKEKEAYERIINYARDSQISILFIDHTTKSVVDRDVYRSIRGTYATSGGFDTLLVFSIPEDEIGEQGEIVRRLSAKGKSIPEQDIRILMDKDTMGIKSVENPLQYEFFCKKKAYEDTGISPILRSLIDDFGNFKGTASEILSELYQRGYKEDISPDAFGKWLTAYKDIMLEVDKINVVRKRVSSRRIIELRYKGEEDNEVN